MSESRGGSGRGIGLTHLKASVARGRKIAVFPHLKAPGAGSALADASAAQAVGCGSARSP